MQGKDKRCVSVAVVGILGTISITGCGAFRHASLSVLKECSVSSSNISSLQMLATLNGIGQFKRERADAGTIAMFGAARSICSSECGALRRSAARH